MKGFGVVELMDDKDTGKVGFFCVKLVAYLNEEAEMGTPEYKELWSQRFQQAKAGFCRYKDKCPIYERTKAKIARK